MRKTLENSAIDIILLDVMMPGEDGLMLCRYVQEKYNIPVILLTALSDDDDKVVGLEMGADDYISKPFNARVLLARLRLFYVAATTNQLSLQKSQRYR